ncbi:MAG TPA: BadF/BadG/BcrA/BcrD ATPase family protein [Opitutus sp.]|nr:BadF/BadG/BcrA/BcrD ATPase family protein [Opitutus sp.]
MIYKIGVDGGGTKTECVLVDAAGAEIGRHLAPASNPSVVGPEQAQLVVTDALCALLDRARAIDPEAEIGLTRLFMAGHAPFWQEFAGGLRDFGEVDTGPDSLPVLELATDGEPGLVIHSGTGSFVAARDPAGGIHYAGGLGWRFGDAGSAYDLGRRAIARALLELQGWAPASRLGPTVRDHAQLSADAETGTLTRYFYSEPAANQKIASLTPALLRLATEGDRTAHALIVESVTELLDLAARVAGKLFAGVPSDAVRTGLSGSILTHPVVMEVLAPRSPLPLMPVTGRPIEGVRRLLARA